VIVVLMGVAGAGKTTIGSLLAEELGWPFLDADELHPPANVEKMRGGQPLTDADREPWLAAVAGWIRATLDAGGSGVLACSALRAAYRDRLGGGSDRVRFVYLRAAPELLLQRLQGRAGHFMPGSLLGSQLEALEEPRAALVLHADAGPEALVRRIRHELDL
jgi:gluconokinase